MKDAVRDAIAEIEADGPGGEVIIEEDADGGAYVIVEDVEIGECFSPSRSWIGFHITFGYPEAHVYPHFIDARVRYVGEKEAPNEHPAGNLPVSITRGDYKLGAFERPAIQVSRSSKRSTGSYTALEKLERVLDFLKSR